MIAVPDEPVALHDHAIDNIRFIRSTMERASTFTAIPGWGTVAVGLTAAGAAFVAGWNPAGDRWLTVWLCEALLAAIISLATILTKAKALQFALMTAPGRRFALAFLPSVFAGAALTWALWSSGNRAVFPALWLLLYGTAVMAGGALSIRIIPVMGLSFALCGLVALFLDPRGAAIVMAAAFSILHVIFGFLIARYHGG